MQHRRLLLLGLSLIILMGLFYANTETGAQVIKGPLGEYTWGYFGGSRESQGMSREDVIVREGSCPTGGCVLKLDQVEVRPSRAHKGDTLNLTTVYTILTPEQVALPVTITRVILFQGKVLGQTKSMDSGRLNGSWTQGIDFTLPADARPGVYTLRTKVSTGYNAAQKDVTFEVY
ncbi:MAG: hypothetical protein NTY36_07990 [Deltaproteobacteria bacterium]|nr:hypothetical protein [Deltaproteobacteria bacterium]